MYSITAKDRRVTDYVKKQAYKWLYTKVAANEYDAHSNDAENLILQIKKSGEVTAETYAEFLESFLNAPYFYILNHNNSKKLRGITAENIFNYFIKFNDVVLPAGFIKEFFEDDYETQEDIREFFKQYAEATLDGFIISCQSIKIDRDNEIEKIKKNNPCIFNTKMSFHVTNVIKIILMIACFVICLSYFGKNDIIGEFIGFFKGDGGNFIRNNMMAVIANCVFLFYLLTQLKKTVTLVLFYVSLLRNRLYVSSLQKSLKDFDDDVIESFKEYFADVNEQMKRTYAITDDMCSSLPATKKQYMFVVDFDCNKIKEKLQKLMKKSSVVNFYYSNDTELAKKKKVWRKGILFKVLLIVIFVFINNPDLSAWAMDTISGMINGL